MFSLECVRPCTDLCIDGATEILLSVYEWRTAKLFLLQLSCFAMDFSDITSELRAIAGRHDKKNPDPESSTVCYCEDFSKVGDSICFDRGTSQSSICQKP